MKKTQTVEFIQHENVESLPSCVYSERRIQNNVKVLEMSLMQDL